MKQFFRELLASCLGSGLAIVIGGGILMMMFFGALADSFGDGGQPITNVKDNSVLQISFGAPIVERSDDKIQQFDLSSLGEDPVIGLNIILEDLAKAKVDDKIQGIFLDMPAIAGSPSTMLDIREAIVSFKESGKWIICFAETMGQGTYYVASAADEIYLYPEGDLSFYGLSAELMYFKGMLDKLDIDVQVLRGPNNKYKSAVEPFINDQMSSSDRAQMEALLGDIWSLMLNQISESRDIPVETLQQLADDLAIGLPQDALDAGLVDGLMYRDQVMDVLRDKLGIAENADTETEGDEEGEEEEEKDPKINFVSFDSYHWSFVKDFKPKGEYKSDRIAVVYAVGAIESGEGDDATIGSERIAGALQRARLDDKVKAIVLRVNSPGGSALASDVIWRETELIKEAGKPFVVSMGDLAASGGYYISCGADKIYANHNTITGSIGVFGMIPNAEGFFNNKLGITFDRVKTGEHADLMTVNKALDPVQDSVINRSITRIYDRFLELVADGRGMTTAEVDSVARGRVWSGEDALEIGLVDELGDLSDAIAYAAEMAELEEYRLRELPRMVDPIEELMKELTGQASQKVLKRELGVDVIPFEQIKEVQRILESDRIQARLPYFIDIY